jgi:uncharacterized protein
MEPLILHHLQRIEQENGIRILYACETGSRGWGFASPDSDFDIRFIYLHKRDKYLSIGQPQDSINTLFEDGGEVLDFNAWDLRKTLHHFRKSNATPFEWLQSPIIYREVEGFKNELWALGPTFFNPQSAVHHYLGICHNSIKTGIANGHIKIKKYFYILRPLLAAMWSADKQTIPPMEFRPLLTQLEDKSELLHAIYQLWEEKEKAIEGHLIPLIPIIQDFIDLEMERCRSFTSENKPKNQSNDALDLLFRKMLIE